MSQNQDQRTLHTQVTCDPEPALEAAIFANISYSYIAFSAFILDYYTQAWIQYEAHKT